MALGEVCCIVGCRIKRDWDHVFSSFGSAREPPLAQKLYRISKIAQSNLGMPFVRLAQDLHTKNNYIGRWDLVIKMLIKVEIRDPTGTKTWKNLGFLQKVIAIWPMRARGSPFLNP